MARAPFIILNGLGQQLERAGVDSGDGSVAELAQLISPDGTDLDLKGLLTALQRADAVYTGSLSLLATTNAVAATVNGQGTASFEIGTPGTALGGTAVGTFEVQRTTGGAWNAAFAYPFGGGGLYPVKTTAVGGIWTVETAGCVGVRFRCAAIGTGAVPVAINLGGLARLLSVVPTHAGRTNFVYDWTLANAQRLVTGTTDAAATAVTSGGPYLLHAKGAAMYVRVNAAAGNAAGSMPLEAGEKFHIALNAGDIVHAIQDTAAGALFILPAA